MTIVIGIVVFVLAMVIAALLFSGKSTDDKRPTKIAYVLMFMGLIGAAIAIIGLVTR